MTDSPHFAGCWNERGHHECAIRRVVELEKLLKLRKKPVEVKPERQFGNDEWKEMGERK